MIQKYFSGFIVFAIAVFALLYMATGDVAALGLAGALAIIEVSLSFDNAIVNAKYLGTMNPMWKKIFLYFGIFIAVIGMRFLFPLAIVSVIGDVSIMTALDWALNDHAQFETTLKASEWAVSGFGGAFLVMVALSYFIDSEREDYWFKALEEKLSKIGLLENINVLITGTAFFVASHYIESAKDSDEFFLASVFGIALHIAIDGIKKILELIDEDSAQTVSTVAKAGLGTFIYLEILDSAFSFDGVLAAFALSDNILVIATGLGIGAMFVRSMTVMLDDTGTLNEYKYLETGAFYSIMFLATATLIKPIFEIPDYAIAVISIGIIVSSVLSSIAYTKQLTKTEGAKHE